MKYITFFCFMVHLSLYSQENKIKEYIFLDKHIDADLNYTGIDSVYKSGVVSGFDSVFNVVGGKYIVYRFLNHDRGDLTSDLSGHISDIFNLIILKTDKENKIIDGYWYSLTTPDFPRICRLYRVSRKIKLIHNLDIDKLKFKREPESIAFLNEERWCSDDIYPLFLEKLEKNGRLNLVEISTDLLNLFRVSYSR
jgi:hypothetical protein